MVAAAVAFALIIAALWLASLYDASFGATAVQPLPRCMAAVGGSFAGWAVCR